MYPTSILLVLLSLCLSSAFAFDCYKCSTTATDDLCLTNPEAISSGDVTVSCSGYCTIVRTEFTDIPGKVHAFVRDCEAKPLIMNEIRTDAHYTKYYRSCTTNKCNSGNGLIGSGSNGGLPSSILLVPENSSSVRMASIVLIIVSLLCSGLIVHF